MKKATYFLVALITIGIAACKSKSTPQQETPAPAAAAPGPAVYKGLYSCSPDVKSFKECGHGHEYWVADSSAQLELQYSQLKMKPEEAVYVEAEGKKIKTKKDGIGGGYDSTLVVTRLVKITKDIPKDICN